MENKTIGEIMTRRVITCLSHQTLSEAAQLLKDHDVGCLPVVDGTGRVVGMLTDRDICLTAAAQRQALGQIRVAAAMSQEVYFCQTNDDPESVERTMIAHRVRRLPVLSSSGMPVGIVTLSDLARAGRYKAYDGVLNTLARVSEPRPFPV